MAEDTGKPRKREVKFTQTNSLLYEKEQVLVVFNRWRLHVLCDHLLRQNRPSLNEAWPWLGTFVACLLGLLTSENFKESFLDLKASTWEAVFVVAAIVSFIMFARAVIRVVSAHFSEKTLTAEEVVAEIMEEMEEQKK